MNIYEWWPVYQEYLMYRFPRNPIMRRQYGRWMTNHNMPKERLDGLLDGFNRWATGRVDRGRILGWLRQTASLSGD